VNCRLACEAAIAASAAAAAEDEDSSKRNLEEPRPSR
jgi:hypothetical protein